MLRDDPQRRELVGQLVSRMVHPETPNQDPLIALIDSLPKRPDLPELTEDEIAAEIRLARAERRS